MANDPPEIVDVLYQLGPGPLGPATEQHTMRQDHRHGAVFVQMMQHVLDKGEIGLGCGRKATVFGEAVVALENLVG